MEKQERRWENCARERERGLNCCRAEMRRLRNDFVIKNPNWWLRVVGESCMSTGSVPCSVEVSPEELQNNLMSYLREGGRSSGISHFWRYPSWSYEKTAHCKFSKTAMAFESVLLQMQLPPSENSEKWKIFRSQSSCYKKAFRAHYTEIMLLHNLSK